MLTPILAEIADKMGTTIDMWMHWSVVAAIAGAISMLHRYVALSMMTVAWIPLVGEYSQAFGEDSFSKSIWEELGPLWVFHSITSASLPLLAVLFVIGFHIKMRDEGENGGEQRGQVHLWHQYDEVTNDR